MQEDNISDTLKTNKKNWYELVLQSNKERMPKTVLRYEPKGRNGRDG